MIDTFMQFKGSEVAVLGLQNADFGAELPPYEPAEMVDIYWINSAQTP